MLPVQNINISDEATKSNSTTPSCQTKPTDPCFENCIIKTNDFKYAPPLQRYNLCDITKGQSGGKGERLCKWLIKILNELADNHKSSSVFKTWKANGGKLPRLSNDNTYSTKSILKDSYYYSIDHTHISKIDKLLASITASTIFKPDVAILWNFVPAILFEINSSSMSKTITKLFTNLMDLLRYIRHFDTSITSWIGFTFPKDEADSTNNFACKVEVVWDECKFVCNVTSLTMEMIKEMVQETFGKQIQLAQQLKINPSPEPFLVPLSKQDLDFIQGKLKDYACTTLKQVKSKFSILLTNGTYYFKLPGNLSHQSALKNLVIKYHQMNPTDRDEFDKHLVLPFHSLTDPIDLFVFRAMKYRLTEHVAKQCLPDLAGGMIDGLDFLHRLGLAHLDVRLPNVCVGEDYNIKLIDFDRSSSRDDVSKYGEHFMYTYETEERKVQHLDWKQFGLLMFTLSSYNGDKRQSKLTKGDIPEDISPFLGSLIFHHTYDSDLMNNWKQSLHSDQTKALKVVLGG